MWGIILALLSLLGLSPLPTLAQLVGTTEAGIKLLLSILISYPLANLYHEKIRKNKLVSVELKHIFFILMGLDMAIFNFGTQIYHNLVPVIVMYISTKCLGPSANNVIFNLGFNMVYLLVGYAATESEDYDITWTMPQCVLTLKMISLSFDLWDGNKLLNNIPISETNKKTALQSSPTILELLGFVYFPACFLVGPIYSFKRYWDYVNEKYPLDRDADIYNKQAVKRLIQGLIYLVAFQVGVSIFSMSYITSEEFAELSIFYRHLYCGLWAHFALYKYISCWLLTEAACIKFGFSYNGEKKDSDSDKTVSTWDGCSNIKLLQFEGAIKFQDYVSSFNCNTNHFAAEYIYKRLKFLNNRNLSQFFTLLFLALWHGTQSGYYMTFLNEFLIIIMEKEMVSILKKYQFFDQLWANESAAVIMYFFLKLYTLIFMGWSLIPFDLKTFSKWSIVYVTLYCSGFIIFAPWLFVYKPLLVTFLPKAFKQKTV